MPSVQSPLLPHEESGPHSPVRPHSGPAVPGNTLHSASAWQAMQLFISQIGVDGVSEQPPLGVQSTHLFVVVSHLSFLPEHAASLTQSTHAADVGSH